MKVGLTVNGNPVEVEGDPMDRLLDVLREAWGLTGTKEGCGEGECGACTVLVDDQPVLSCLIPLGQCSGRDVLTVEGLESAGAVEFLDRFVETGGVQCGACTPGILMSAWALLQENPRPSRDDVKDHLAGNLCRCTGYEGIYRALQGERD